MSYARIINNIYKGYIDYGYMSYIGYMNYLKTCLLF